MCITIEWDTKPGYTILHGLYSLLRLHKQYIGYITYPQDYINYTKGHINYTQRYIE